MVLYSLLIHILLYVTKERINEKDGKDFAGGIGGFEFRLRLKSLIKN